jgi:hypothetical protein
MSSFSISSQRLFRRHSAVLLPRDIISWVLMLFSRIWRLGSIAQNCAKHGLVVATSQMLRATRHRNRIEKIRKYYIRRTSLARNPLIAIDLCFYLSVPAASGLCVRYNLPAAKIFGKPEFLFFGLRDRRPRPRRPPSRLAPPPLNPALIFQVRRIVAVL